MPQSSPKDIRLAENLRREGKLQEALEVINKIEKKGTLAPSDQLAVLISKGKILTMYQRLTETIRVGKLTYRLSESLGKTNEMVTSLFFKSSCIFLGQFDKGLKYLFEAEKLLNSLSDSSPSYLSKQKKNILFRKSWVYQLKGDTNDALETALECLELQKKFGSKVDIAYTLQLLGNICNVKGEINLAFDYTSKSLSIFEEINDQGGKAASLVTLGLNSLAKGNLNQAKKFLKQSLSYKMMINRLKVDCLMGLGSVYQTRGELDKALKHYKSGLVLSEKGNFYNSFISFQLNIGTIYILKGDYELAIEYLKVSLSLAEKMKYERLIANSLIVLGIVYIQLDALEEVQKYLDRLNKPEIQMKTHQINDSYLLLKAMFLIKKGGTLNRGEAHTLLKQISTNVTHPLLNTLALIYLCEFYLDEINLFEDIEVLKELNPLIEQLYKVSEEQHLYYNLAEAKLLQAKVSLIQMDFEVAQQLLTQAQRVAEMYGINFTAQKISNEHDNYLEKLSEWKKLKEKEASISERLKLASVEGVLDRLQGKSAIEPPELVEEEPIVLLIMDKSGISYFNYTFIENWDSEWLFSSFMSAFDTFSSALFSESIDRIRIGENIILVNPIESFLICYVIKGQSYLGLQKLNRFSEVIKNNTDIWESLSKAVQTGEELELDNPRALGEVVNEIFIQ
ncbi:MAG: tetratricopeptide repeat protein [Candidatus Hodarchaeales archaeon]|jgi:tetratricopeptide (TPR) repeat protein